MFTWLFRSRQTGRVTIAQLPNTSLWIFLVATALRLFTSPHGGFRTALNVAAAGALLWWAGDEIVRGVNPFRRMLGAVVLAGTVVGLVR